MDFDCVISLTTWRGRINHPDVPKVLFSIFRQKTQYKFKVVLVLSEEEFPEKDAAIPSEIKMFVDNGLLEIIWTVDNLKAYKKLYPTMKKYPNVPIMTTDDDIFLESTCVETFMNQHKNTPNTILTEGGHSFMAHDEIVTGVFRLFPPNSLLDVDPSYFKICYNACEDDAYLAVLAKLKGTHTRILNTGLAKESKSNIQNVAFRHEYLKISAANCRQKLYAALRKDGII